MNLFKPAFLISILGILFLLFLSINYSSEKLQIEGNITKINYYDNLAVITLSSSSQIENQTQILIFTNENLNLKRGDYVLIEGKLGENETIVAEKVIKHD